MRNIAVYLKIKYDIMAIANSYCKIEHNARPLAQKYTLSIQIIAIQLSSTSNFLVLIREQRLLILLLGNIRTSYLIDTVLILLIKLTENISSL